MHDPRHAALANLAESLEREADELREEREKNRPVLEYALTMLLEQEGHLRQAGYYAEDSKVEIAILDLERILKNTEPKE